MKGRKLGEWKSYDNRLTHDMFSIIEGQPMESQSPIRLILLHITFVRGAFPALILIIIMIAFIVIH